MPERQSTPLADGPAENGPDFDIVVKERSSYPWPSDIKRETIGKPTPRIRMYFVPFIALVRHARRDYSWKFFYTNPETGRSFIEAYPAVLHQVERLFHDELGTSFSQEQRGILLNSQIVTVAVSRKDDSIAGYFSSSYIPSGTITDVDIPLTLGKHGVISRKHQQFKIGVTMGAISMIHGQRIRDLVRTVGCVLRTNNRHIFNPLDQSGVVYRSDRLSDNSDLKHSPTARAAILHMHNEVFGLKNVSLPFDKPLQIGHRFDAEVTIEGVAPDQIIYVFCRTSLIRLIFRLLARRARRKIR